MKATARAHPIQGIVKYHGMRDHDMRLPYHDSISVCTAPSNTTTTVAFDPDRKADVYVVDGEELAGHGADRVRSVVEEVRRRAGIDDRVRLESENSFRTNVGLGSSASGFAAAATALVEAAGLVIGMVPAYKETEAAHREAESSHMFDARLAHIHHQIAEGKDALRAGDFDRTFELGEQDSLSLAATTMTGEAGWVYWKPETLAIFDAVRDLREEGIPAYFSTDTGASVYVNTTAEHADRVEAAIAEHTETRIWEVGGPARVLDPDEALF